jgi:hypothetical protein
MSPVVAGRGFANCHLLLFLARFYLDESAARLFRFTAIGRDSDESSL